VRGDLDQIGSISDIRTRQRRANGITSRMILVASDDYLESSNEPYGLIKD
jgi:hypothetical protein